MAFKDKIHYNCSNIEENICSQIVNFSHIWEAKEWPVCDFDHGDEAGLDILDPLDYIVLCLILMNGVMIYIIIWMIVVKNEKQIWVV